MKSNNNKQFSKSGVGRVAESISLLPDQMRQVFDEMHLIKIPREYSKINKVVVSGMGGSNIGAHIVKAVFSDRLKAPINIEAGYGVPAYVDKNTLYVLSSYSGTTEETLSTYKEARKRGAKIIAITADVKKNKLAKLMMKDNIPGYIFKPRYNPSEQPRLAVGYSAFGTAVLLAKAGLFEMAEKEALDVIAELEIWDRELRPGEGVDINSAKRIAGELLNKQIVLVGGAEFLAGNLKALRNQFCETSKNFTSYLALPDLNHFAMEGLAFPESNKKDLAFFFFDSKIYHPRVRKRSELTKEVVRRNGIKAISHELKGKTRFMQGFEMLQLGSWITFYLGKLNGVDPVKISWVDWFKEELGK